MAKRCSPEADSSIREHAKLWRVQATAAGWSWCSGVHFIPTAYATPQLCVHSHRVLLDNSVTSPPGCSRQSYVTASTSEYLGRSISLRIDRLLRCANRSAATNHRSSWRLPERWVFGSCRAGMWLLFALHMTLRIGSAESSRLSPAERSPRLPISAHKSIQLLPAVLCGTICSI